MKNLIFLAVFLFSACRVSKDISQLTNTTPAQYRNSNATDTNHIGLIQWREFFKEQQLQQLIDTALVKNYDLQIAVQNLEIAEENLKQSRQSLLPTVALNVGANSTVPSKNSLNGSFAQQFLGKNHIDDFTASLGVAWEADFWGKTRNRKRAARAAWLQTDEARKSVQTIIIASIAKSYYNLLMLDEQLEVARKNILLTDSTVRILTLQQQSGQVTALARQQAEAQRLSISQLIPQIERDILVQENNLSILTGTNPHDIARQGSLPSIDPSLQLAEGVPASMVSNRPDVRALEYALTTANANVGLAKADFYPALNISASGGVNSLRASDWFQLPTSLFGIVAGSVVQPLLQRRQIRTKYNISLIQREQSVTQFRQSVLQAVGEVSDAMGKMDKIEDQYSLANERVVILQQATRNAHLLYQNGMANYLEVITAQANVLDAELALAGLKLAHLNAVTDLYRALGGGWR